MQNNRLYSSSVPSYVSIYNSLYLDIVNNVYAQGELLPGEVQLAQKYGVSRNTLRQALAILNEDGLIIKSQGKGTLVARRDDRAIPKRIFNPMTTLCKQRVDDVEIQFNYASPTDIARNRLALGMSEIVLASNLVYRAGDSVVGYAFMQVPARVLEALEIDVADDEAIIELLSATLYEKAESQSLHVKLIHANELEVEFLRVPEGTPLIMVESILSRGEEALARCKFYFLPEHYSIRFLLK
ncbi:MAG TPA: GntR family transcriptional regulator [Clostridia bacterium]|nr:GntR family transcriptional regulator [Clostridia bacterium]